MTRRRPLLSVIGSSGPLPAEVRALALELGRRAIDAGFRLVTGGRDGVMEAASEGARSSEAWRDGDVLGILPGADDSGANRFVDVVLPTGIGLARNALVAQCADVVIAVAGAAGTLSEIAYAWQFGKPIVALVPSGGWAARLAGQRLDGRYDRPIAAAASPAEAISQALEAVRG